jgi:hypothetical protein
VSPRQGLYAFAVFIWCCVLAAAHFCLPPLIPVLASGAPYQTPDQGAVNVFAYGFILFIVSWIIARSLLRVRGTRAERPRFFFSWAAVAGVMALFRAIVDQFAS